MMDSMLTTILPIAIGVCFTGGMIVLFAAIFVPMIIRLVRNSQMTNQVLKTGVDATATILSTWDTGMRINDNPQVGMKLQVNPPYGAPFQAEVTKTVSIVQLAQFQPGAQLNVKYDPANPTHVAITEVAAGALAGMPPAAMPAQAAAASAMNPQQVEQMLLQYDAANQQLIKTGVQAHATVLQYLPLSILVDGENPVVNLMLEVRPVSMLPFTAMAQGVAIVQAAVPKYQPGQTVTVRYNPADLSRVAVEHSGL